MDSTPWNPESAPAEGPRLAAELQFALQDRLRRDPELCRLVTLFGRWLMEAAAIDSTPGCDAPAAEPAEATWPAELASSDACGSGGPAVTNGEAEVNRVEAPADAADDALDPGQLAALLDRYGAPAVSPLIRGVLVTPARSVGSAPVRRPLQSLEVYVRRMELKADACAWAVKRHDELLAGGGFAPVKEEYERLRARADTMQPCFLWMIHPDAKDIGREDWVRLEGCYRACAEVLRTIFVFPDAYAEGPDLLKLLGESQSAVRAAMSSCGAVPRWSEPDQQYVFEWCRDEGAARRIFNPFLSLDRLADPSLHAGLLARARRLRDELQTVRDAERLRQRGLNTVRYHLGQLEEGQGDADHHWQRIGDGIDQILESGAAASLPELIEILVPVADDVPRSLYERPGVRRVMGHVDERLAAQQRPDEHAPVRREPTREILLVREALRGTTMVLIGGKRRPYSEELIEREFELAELAWLQSESHQSIASFVPVIARPETRVVILMIRWASHSYEDLQEVCDRHGKVFVRLPGGYNPSQIAHQVMEQASAQLGIREP